MPLHESKDVTVTVVVEVDGHKLTFTENGRVSGARYNGADPRDTGFSSSHTLEEGIRGAADSCLARAHRSMNAFLRNAYPVVGDR